MRAGIARIAAVVALTAISAIPQRPVAFGQVGQGAEHREGVRRAPAGSPPGYTAVPRNSRRDLFVPPPGVGLGGAGNGGPLVQLPPMPVPELSGPTVPPGSLPALPGLREGRGTQEPPPVFLRGVILGIIPQAVLVSAGAYKIVTVGQATPWGTVRAITATTVTIEASAGPRTLTFDMRPQPSKATPTGGTH